MVGAGDSATSPLEDIGKGRICPSQPGQAWRAEFIFRDTGSGELSGGVETAEHGDSGLVERQTLGNPDEEFQSSL